MNTDPDDWQVGDGPERRTDDVDDQFGMVGQLLLDDTASNGQGEMDDLCLKLDESSLDVVDRRVDEGGEALGLFSPGQLTIRLPARVPGGVTSRLRFGTFLLQDDGRIDRFYFGRRIRSRVDSCERNEHGAMG